MYIAVDTKCHFYSSLFIVILVPIMYDKMQQSKKFSLKLFLSVGKFERNKKYKYCIFRYNRFAIKK